MSDASRHDLRDDREDDRDDDLAVLPEPFALWFAARGWTPRPYQLGLLQKARAGRSTLLIAPTGAGKTVAGVLPTLVELSVGAPRLRQVVRQGVRPVVRPVAPHAGRDA